MNTATFRYTDLGKYTAEASDLGLKPGEWPQTLEATHASGPNTGTTALLRLTKIHHDREGDVTHAEYTFSAVGRHSPLYLVWND